MNISRRAESLCRCSSQAASSSSVSGGSAEFNRANQDSGPRAISSRNHWAGESGAGGQLQVQAVETPLAAAHPVQGGLHSGESAARISQKDLPMSSRGGFSSQLQKGSLISRMRPDGVSSARPPSSQLARRGQGRGCHCAASDRFRFLKIGLHRICGELPHTAGPARITQL